MSQQSPDSGTIGPPQPIEVPWPIDWNVEAFHYIFVAVCYVLLFAVASGATGSELQWPVWALAALIALLPSALLVKAIRHSLGKCSYEFGIESVRVPSQWLFGSPHEFRYDEVESLQKIRTALMVQLEDGRAIKLSSYRAQDAIIIAALELRLGYAAEQKGRYDDAEQYYQSASHFHRPALDLRIAQGQARAGDPGLALENFMRAFVDHRIELGPNDPCTIFLKERIERHRREHEGAESSHTLEEIETMKEENREFEYAAPMRDRWVPSR